MKRFKLTIILSVLACLPGLALAQPATGPRPLAPGVLKEFPPELNVRDTMTVPMTLPGLSATKYDTHYTPQSATLAESGRNVIFYRDIWHYDFATLGLRQIQLGFRQPDGEILVRHFWYMVFRIRDTGQSISYEDVSDPDLQGTKFAYTKKVMQRNALDTQSGSVDNRVHLQFNLEGWVLDEQGNYVRVVYRDQFLPDVAREIQKLEDANQRLFNKFEISEVKIPRAEPESGDGVWGVAVWENVNPELDYVSVYVRGLTNAYRIRQQAGGDLELKAKTLQLNFWRPGDRARQILDKVQYGVPLVDSPREQVEICRRYQLPGPQIAVFQVGEQSAGNIPIGEVDAAVDLEEFASPVVDRLNSGSLPEGVRQLLLDAGAPVDADTPVTTVLAGLVWQIEVAVDGKQRKYVLHFEPSYWELQEKGIRFIKGIDHLWIYR